MFVICGISLLMLFLGNFALVRAITEITAALDPHDSGYRRGRGRCHCASLEAAGGFARDELGEVSRLFNLFMDKLQEILRGVAAHTHKLAAASQQLLEASAADYRQLRRNCGAVELRFPGHAAASARICRAFPTGAGEMTSTIQNIATNTNEAAKHGLLCRQRGASRQRHRREARPVQRRNRRSHQGHHLHRGADQPAGLECNH